MTTLTDAELLELPDDPSLAFLAIEAKARELARSEIATSENSSADEDSRLVYLTTVISAAQALEIPDFRDWPIPRVSEKASSAYNQLLSEVTAFSVLVRVKNARRTRRYSIALDPATKVRVRHLLNQLKDAVDKLEVSDAKRERLYARIRDLEDEMNRNRTKFEAITSLVLAASETAGKAATNMEPLWKWVHPLLDALGKAKDEEDERVPQLSPPLRQIEGPKFDDTPAAPKASEDDEIPF
jgi:hypothetical protein